MPRIWTRKRCRVSASRFQNERGSHVKGWIRILGTFVTSRVSAGAGALLASLCLSFSLTLSLECTPHSDLDWVVFDKQSALIIDFEFRPFTLSDVLSHTKTKKG